MNRLAFLLLFFAAIVSSCDQSANNNENLPVARGAAGEIILVMDSTNWRGAVGDALRDIFMAPMPGLPQEEPMYTLNYVNPIALNSVLKSAKNMIFVTTLEGQSRADRILKSYFTKASLERIENDPSLYLYSRQNEFAKGQEILHLFGKDEAVLIAHLTANAEQIRGYFDRAEGERLKKALFTREEKGIEKALEDQHDFFIRVPYGYEIAKNEERFVWLRQLGRDIDKNIFIAYRNYDTEGLFSKDSLLGLREAVAKEYIYDAQDTSLYVTTQRIAPVDTVEINFNGHYSVKMKGLWKLTDNSLGGPFISYTLVDEALNRLYYIEGFVSSPGKDKKDLVREIEVILSTFKTSDNKEG